MKKVIISTDCALDRRWHDPDDSLALLYLLSQTNVKVTAIISTFGNTTEDQVCESIAKVLSILKLEVPVIRGAKNKNDNPAEVRELFRSIGCKEHSILSMGPLTNFKHIDVNTLRSFAGFWIMGGALRVIGNMPPLFAEFNFAKDPVALNYVFRNISVNCVPLDTTAKIRLSCRLVSCLKKRWPSIGEHIRKFDSFFRTIFQRHPSPHDLVMAIAFTHRELFRVESLNIRTWHGLIRESRSSPRKQNMFFVEDQKPISRVIENWLK